MKKIIVIILIIFAIMEINCQQEKIFGVKVYHKWGEFEEKYKDNIEQLIQELKSFGLNTVFMQVYEGQTAYYQSDIFTKSDTSFDIISLRNKLKENDINFAAICHVFYDNDFLENHPEAAPVDNNDNNNFTNWQKLVCPSNEDYKKYKLEIIKEVAEKFHPDIISLDFIRYPIYWEQLEFDTPFENLRHFCFCDNCINNFCQENSIIFNANQTRDRKILIILKEYFNDWKRYKCKIITDYVKIIHDEIHKIDSNIRIAIHTLPWSEDVFYGGIQWLAGQDVDSLSKYMDIFSPMIYNKMLDLPAEYINQLTNVLFEKTGKAIIPSIQTDKILKEDFSLDDFKEALIQAKKSPSSGFLLFYWGNLISKKDIQDILKKILKK